MKLTWEFHDPKNTGVSQIICTYMLLITTFCLHTNSLLLLTECLALVNANISWNTTFTAVVIFGQISTGSMDILFKSILDKMLRTYSILYVSITDLKKTKTNKQTNILYSNLTWFFGYKVCKILAACSTAFDRPRANKQEDKPKDATENMTFLHNLR